MQEFSVPDDDGVVVDAVLAASRAIVALAVRSLSRVSEQVTLTQYRALVVLASRGSRTLASLAEELAVGAPTASRLCDRLVREGLVTRVQDAHDRRSVQLTLTGRGQNLLEQVTDQRRAEIARILRAVPAEEHLPMIIGLRRFAEAAGEVPEQEWSAGWRL